MPVIGPRTVTAATDDALQGLKFKVQGSPSLVSLYASSAAAGDTIEFSVGSREIAVDQQVNLESADRVIDTDRDQLLFQERVPPGEFYLRIPAVGGADLTFMLVIDPIDL